jgi:hypothetical protein
MPGQQLAADPEVKALAEGSGNPTDNVTIPNGNFAAYLVRRLKRLPVDCGGAGTWDSCLLKKLTKRERAQSLICPHHFGTTVA